MKRLLELGWIGAALSALGAVLIAVLANLYIFVLRPFGATEGIPIGQAGPVGGVIEIIVPYVWLVLFAAMGIAFWLTARAEDGRIGRAWLIAALVGLCAAYPIYTGNLNSPAVALAGNGAVIALAAFAAWRIWPLSAAAAALLLPVIAWVALASVALIALMTGQRF